MENQIQIPYRWARKTNEPNYEVSSFGDKRFSSLVATLSDGRTIEEAYQLDVKGYRSISSDWRAGKGKPPMIPNNDLPKITSHYFELKGDKFNIFKELTQLSNCCSKLIANLQFDKSTQDFVRIVTAEHRAKVNPDKFETDDIVLCLIDPRNKEHNSYDEALNSLVSSATVGVKAFVVPVEGNSIISSELFRAVKEIVSPRYTNIPGTGYFIDLYNQYRNLWSQWAIENIDTLEDLAVKAHGKVLTDIYATTEISQARALADILNKFYNLSN